MGPIQSLDDFIDMTRRRMWIISFVAFIGCIVSLWFALKMQHIYSSSEVIQIEQPKIEDDLARSTVDGSSARRQQLIQQQLMARDNLQRVIDKYGLFADLPALKPSDKIFLMRSQSGSRA